MRVRRCARKAVRAQAAALVDHALGQAARKAPFVAFETGLIALIMAFARSLVVLFLVASEQRERAALEGRVVLGGVRSDVRLHSHAAC